MNVQQSISFTRDISDADTAAWQGFKTGDWQNEVNVCESAWVLLVFVGDDAQNL